MEKKGYIIVIEGTDGSGKATQSRTLECRFKNAGYKAIRFSFPNYDSPSSSLVKMYLGGEFGNSAEKVPPKIASMMYALDRYATWQKEIKEYYKKGYVIILDRYTTANMVHQVSKVDNLDEKEDMIFWLKQLEYGTLELPVPDKVFFLSVTPEQNVKLMKDRKNEITGEDKKDIHESDVEHLQKSYENGVYVARYLGWDRIECVTPTGFMHSVPHIADLIVKKIKKAYPVYFERLE